jgi:hypothetical protein
MKLAEEVKSLVKENEIDAKKNPFHKILVKHGFTPTESKSYKGHGGRWEENRHVHMYSHPDNKRAVEVIIYPDWKKKKYTIHRLNSPKVYGDKKSGLESDLIEYQ